MPPGPPYVSLKDPGMPWWVQSSFQVVKAQNTSVVETLPLGLSRHSLLLVWLHLTRDLRTEQISHSDFGNILRSFFKAASHRFVVPSKDCPLRTVSKSVGSDPPTGLSPPKGLAPSWNRHQKKSNTGNTRNSANVGLAKYSAAKRRASQIVRAPEVVSELSSEIWLMADL